MTIETALRSVAGFFILLSLVLAHYISPVWLLFTTFVGLNLLQSGFTGWCPMMWLLDKLHLTNVVNVEGGTMAWQQAGLPVEAASEATDASQGWGRSGWLRLGGALGVVISLSLGIAVSPYFAVVAGALWIAMAVTGNSPCCWADGCSTGRRT